MLELPEAVTLAVQMNDTIRGKRVSDAVADTSKHKFAWYYGDPAEYGERLRGKVIGDAKAYGGRLEIEVEDVALQFGDGVNLRYYAVGERLPVKHQLLVTFDDGSALCATVAMYGGIWCSPKGAMDDEPYVKVAKEAVSPLSDAFDYAFFVSLVDERTRRLSAKAFLATEQRIPGLGNGVLQDILLNARIHPKKKIATMDDDQLRVLFDSVKSTLSEMTRLGGRDTERDLYGSPGGYKTKLSRNTAGMYCANCGGTVHKEAYMGGSIYYCDQCQIK